MEATDDSVLAWHFVDERGCIPRLAVPAVTGLVLVHEGPVDPCRSGLHASVRAYDALRYANSHLLTRVKCSGTVVHQADKLACSRREILAGPVDVERELRLWGCWCARRAMALVAQPDPRSLAAIDTAERYARGEATKQELADAWAAANAARDAARAAWAAANAARDAASDADRAAWAAARAARAAASDAEVEVQAAELERRMRVAVGEVD